MDSKPLAKHKVNITHKALHELKIMDREVTEKLYVNFIAPIENGCVPPNDLQGRYKPSCNMPFINTPMKQAFIDISKQHNLHHYHFGYKFYKNGNEVNFAGDVSDGIIHTKVTCGDDFVYHNILEVCLEHPSPFKIPYLRVGDELIA